MITALLLLPVFAILTWLYWYLLPDRIWQMTDTLIFVTVVMVTTAWILLISGMEFPTAGPLWPQIISVVGAYAVLTFGLAIGLIWRRRKG